MSTILKKLHNDHVNLSKLIKFLERQLILLKSCKTSDIVTTIDAIRYMKDYPDFVHHPLENVVFYYYLDHYKEAHEEILYLLNEHQQMAALTEKLFVTLEGVLAGEPQNRQILCDTLDQYIAIQAEHMNQEEANIFPMLKSTLNKQDWINIQSELSEIKDPLFGVEVKQTYKQLLYHIEC